MMKNLRKIQKYLISFILSLLAILMAIYSWGPLWYTAYFTRPQQMEGYETPGNTFGINYPSSLFIWFGVFLVIFLFLMFLVAKKRKVAPSYLFWINGISISIIFAFILTWINGGNTFWFWHFLICTRM